jgi:endonuclease YncB( thermonuclease family)
MALPSSTPTPTLTPTKTEAPAATATTRATNTIAPIIATTDTPSPSPSATQLNTALSPSTDTDSTDTELTPKPSPTSSVPEDAQAAQVFEVVDGDTIKVRIDGETQTVRYIGIDTPETKHPSKPVEWMGPEATEANKELVAGKEVWLVKDVSETDQYGRLLRYVYLVDGTFVNAELVKEGYAQASSYPPDVKHSELFAELQTEARENERGLWGATPMPTNTPTALPPTATPVRPTNTPVPPTPVPTEPPPTAASTNPPPTATSPPAATPGEVVITYIFYDGVVKRVESDEFAVIKNVGGSPVNLSGWRLNAGNPGQDFWFPNFELQPGQECRVYTNENHPESCGFSFGSGQALWNNGGDCGHLYDSNGVEVSSYCY